MTLAVLTVLAGLATAVFLASYFGARPRARWGEPVPRWLRTTFRALLVTGLVLRLIGLTAGE